MRIELFLCFVGLLFLLCCHVREDRLTLLEARDTGIYFNNLIAESDTLNVLLFEYMYNGGGVGVGDFNNDGLADIFFAGNMVSSQLYLNKGNFKFEDITVKAGVKTQLWCTGVSVVDINQDNLLDIYVCTVNPHIDQSSPNLLFLNKGVDARGMPIFEEVGEKAGLADRSYSTQAAFFDYDLDGDLDMYLLTNALENYTRNSPIGQRTDGGGKSVDKLYRNEGVTAGIPLFKDVSKEAGILTEGWGLGIIVNDINRDGYPDVYVANDFLSNDLLYINNGNGTFVNEISHCLKHQEYNGMGVDMGDINNDGLNDIIAVDMMPDDNLRQKTMFSNTGYDRFQKNLQMNYQPQYVRNVLQLNNGNGTFSDIGYLSGIYATDWSWSPLLADFDNDGFQDLLITNGYVKDITDLDFVTYSKESSLFGTDKARLKNAMKAVAEIEGVKKSNFMFKNNGDLKFTNKAKEWGISQPSYSNGAAYADFDNDGDLDIVMNNINDQAFLYRNNTMEMAGGRNHYLRVMLAGSPGNSEGIGTKVEIYYGGKKQYREHQVHRGYQSSVETGIHFGLDNVQQIDTLKITWPGGKCQTLTNVGVNQVLTLEATNAVVIDTPGRTVKQPFFWESSKHYNIHYKHAEESYIDFKSTPTLPQKYSQRGPGIAVGDINCDGLEDFIVGGPAHKAAVIFLQQKNGVFRKDSLKRKSQEDMGMLLFDADGDHDLDLYCVSGSTEFTSDEQYYQDRFYRNTGSALVLDTTALPVISASGSCVTACDFDKDGDLDLFVGGGVVPGRYPEPPQSYLLRNNGRGKFEDVTSLISSSLQYAGMVSAALWTDFDNDGWIDLALVGEWMPVSFFKNDRGKTLKRSYAEASGWWNSITGGDFDKDGDIDYICGNLGLNSVFQASSQQPVSIYAKDYDHSGSVDPLLSRYIQGKEYLIHPRETLTDQIVSLKRRLKRYTIYGEATCQDIIQQDWVKDALIYRSTNFESAYLENKGDGKFNIRPLPITAQFSPIYGVSATDINNDGNLDVLAVGNSYASEPLSGFYDAGTGVCLLGNGKGDFKPLSIEESGFFADSDTKGLVELKSFQNNFLRIVTANQDSLKIFEQYPDLNMIWITPHAKDVFAELIFHDGSMQKREIYYGAGYLSQSSRMFTLPNGVVTVFITDTHGNRRKVWDSTPLN